MTRVLLIEDNERLAIGLKANLEVEGYQVRTAPDGETGLEEARSFNPHLVILDLMLPDVDGFEVLERLRDSGNGVPVLILSARGEEVDKVRGFQGGADDYVTKPFSLMELMARVTAMLRRSSSRPQDASSPEDEDSMERYGSVEVNPEARTVHKAGEVVHLTPKAFDLLLALIRRRGRVATRLELMEEVWGHQAAVQSRTVDAHISELRSKLEDRPSDPTHILTVWKVGYRLEA